MINRERDEMSSKCKNFSRDNAFIGRTEFSNVMQISFQHHKQKYFNYINFHERPFLCKIARETVACVLNNSKHYNTQLSHVGKSLSLLNIQIISST
jgi:hypothetical protein